MKIGSAVLGVHIAALFALSLTQGCVTTESEGTSTAVQHGPFRHEHSGKSSASMMTQVDQPLYPDNFSEGPLYTPVEPIDVTPINMPSESATTTETYIVRKGDTLSQLAVDFDTTTAELARLNGLSNPDVLYVGQELSVPAGRGGVSSASSSKSSQDIKKGGTYTIQKGDTLSEIAIAAGVGIDSLRKLNNIEGDKIMAGETLDIPAGGKVPTTTKKSTTPKKTVTKTAPKVAEPDLAEPELAEPELALPEMTPVVDEVEATDSASLSVVEERVLYPGETLDDIAREYGVSKAEILRVNNNITDESQVQAGTRLRIPLSE